MADVVVTIKVLNTRDPYRRQTLMSLDKLPPSDWTKKADYTDKSQHRKFVHSGDSVTNTFRDVKDGKHTLYFAVGMDESQGLGAWSGVADVGGVIRPFERVDFDTIAKFDFTVKNGKVVDSQKKEPTAPSGKPTPTRQGSENQSGGDTSAGSTGQKGKVGDMLDGAKDWVKDHKTETVVGVVVTGVVGGLVAWAATRKKRRM